MKRRLNILCAIVLLVMSWSVGVSLYYMGLGMTKGVQMGLDAAREMEEGKSSVKLEEVNNMRTVSLLPKLLSEWKGEFFTDSVRNEKTGQYVPMAYSNLLVSYSDRYLDSRNPSPAETDFFTVTRMDAWGMSTWFMCTPEAAGKLIAMDYDNLAVQETTIVG